MIQTQASGNNEVSANCILKVRKATMIRYLYNQVPHLKMIPHGKVTKIQLNITNKTENLHITTANITTVLLKCFCNSL